MSGVDPAVATTPATTAPDLAMPRVTFGPSDEVLIPGFTYSASGKSAAC
jgi:dTDP-4-amino-4,6-dideoxygalactose transaminase